MCGCGSGAILEALPTPLGSTAALFNPPAFAGPRAIPLIGTFPIAPEPAGRANPPIAAKPACPPPCPPRAKEAAGRVKTMNNAIATFTEVLDIGSTTMISRERRGREADVGAQSADTIKLNFINWILESISVVLTNKPARGWIFPTIRAASSKASRGFCCQSFGHSPSS
jgi:hypothetical protein